MSDIESWESKTELGGLSGQLIYHSHVPQPPRQMILPWPLRGDITLAVLTLLSTLLSFSHAHLFLTKCPIKIITVVVSNSTILLKVSNIHYSLFEGPAVTSFSIGPPPGQGGYYPQQPPQSYQGGPPPQGYGQQPYGGQYQPQPPPQTVYV